MEALIDFDGVIAKQVNGQFQVPSDEIGSPIKGAIQALRRMKLDGYRIIIFTGRIDPQLGELAHRQQALLEEWLIKHNVPFDGFYPKPYSTRLIIDDISRRKL